MKNLLTGLSIALLSASVALAANQPKLPQASEHFITAENAGQQLGFLAVRTGGNPRIAGQSMADRDQEWQDAARVFARNRADLFGAVGTEDFTARGVVFDQIGQVHIRLQETLAGLPVVGGDVIVHAKAGDGSVLGINGTFLPDASLARSPRLGADEAIDRAISRSGIKNGQITDAPELTYVLDGDGMAFLAWASRVRYYDEEGLQIDRIFSDAMTGRMVARHPEVYRAKSRKIYSCNNGTSLPGSLLWSEGGTPTSDTAAQAAYNYSGNVWDYYKTVHGRDSYDNAGAQLISSVHFSSSYNNAYWNGSQMVYGDGDGTTFIALSKGLDVDAHELTHAVTERTAGLVYSNESGALNEATSDILGSSCEAWVRGINSNTWKLGEDIYTPGTAGDALRYLNDPALAGDKDYYPTRYTGTSDNGGVHTNSGIANLAYYLMVAGGTHPRGKTTISVPALSTTMATSLDMAQKIWYRALTVYFTSGTNFAAARTKTMQAASDLYGAAANTAVDKAWQAVGVGSGTPPPPTCTNYTGSLAAGGSAIQPNGNYYQTTVSGTQSGKLTGPSGTDFDLYLFKWNGSAWTQVASSTSSTSVENISYSGTAGYYYFKIVAYAGSGSYTVCISHP